MVASIAAWALVLGYVATVSSIVGGFVEYSNILLKTFISHTIPPICWCDIGRRRRYHGIPRREALRTSHVVATRRISTACIVVVMVLVLWKNGLHLDWPQVRLQGNSIAGIRLGLVLAIFSFVGFESATTLGHEANNRHAPYHAPSCSARWARAFFLRPGCVC